LCDTLGIHEYESLWKKIGRKSWRGTWELGSEFEDPAGQVRPSGLELRAMGMKEDEDLREQKAGSPDPAVMDTFVQGGHSKGLVKVVSGWGIGSRDVQEMGQKFLELLQEEEVSAQGVPLPEFMRRCVVSSGKLSLEEGRDHQQPKGPRLGRVAWGRSGGTGYEVGPTWIPKVDFHSSD
jgi:hypothetical protein